LRKKKSEIKQLKQKSQEEINSKKAEVNLMENSLNNLENHFTQSQGLFNSTENAINTMEKNIEDSENQIKALEAAKEREINSHLKIENILGNVISKLGNLRNSTFNNTLPAPITPTEEINNTNETNNSINNTNESDNNNTEIPENSDNNTNIQENSESNSENINANSTENNSTGIIKASFLQLTSAFEVNKEKIFLQISEKADQNKLNKLLAFLNKFKFDVAMKRGELIDDFDEEINKHKELISEGKSELGNMKEINKNLLASIENNQKEIEQKKILLVQLKKEMDSLQLKFDGIKKIEKEVEDLEKDKNTLTLQGATLQTTLNTYMKLISTL